MSSLSPRISGPLSGHYRLEEEIGAGGMATVYLAHDLRHDRRVAVKVLRPELAAVIGAEARLATTPGLRVVSRDTAFTGLSNTTTGTANYDVSRDGSRLVIPSGGAVAYPLIVVPNWRTELRERLAASRHPD